MKPLNRQSLHSAFSDMKDEMMRIRRELHSQIAVNSNDNYIVGKSYLDTKETRRLNEELGLSTIEGINQWYQ